MCFDYIFYEIDHKPGQKAVRDYKGKTQDFMDRRQQGVQVSFAVQQ